MIQGFSRSMSFYFKKCNKKTLEEGLKCMEGPELDAYLQDLKISLGFLHNYIDYENIENPVQTIYFSRFWYRLNPDKLVKNKFFF